MTKVGRKESFDAGMRLPLEGQLAVVLGGSVQLQTHASSQVEEPVVAFIDLHETFGGVPFLLNTQSPAGCFAHESDTRTSSIHANQVQGRDWAENVWLFMYLAQSMCKLFRQSTAATLPNRLLASVQGMQQGADLNRVTRHFDTFGLPVTEALINVLDCKIRSGTKSKQARVFVFRYLLGVEYQAGTFSSVKPPFSMSFHSITNIQHQGAGVLVQMVQGVSEVAYVIEVRNPGEGQQVFELLYATWLAANGGQPGGQPNGGWERMWGCEAALPTLVRLVWGSEQATVANSMVFSRGQVINIHNGSADLWVILAGAAAIVRNQQLICRLEPGDIFGEVSFLEGQDEDDQLSQVMAVDDQVQVVPLHANRVRPLLEQQPALAGELYCHVAVKLALRNYKTMY